MATGSTCEPRGAGTEPDEGIFATIDEAVKAAGIAYGEFSLVSLERRKGFIEAMRQVGIDNAERFARDAVAETGLGRSQCRPRQLRAHRPGPRDRPAAAARWRRA